MYVGFTASRAKHIYSDSRDQCRKEIFYHENENSIRQVQCSLMIEDVSILFNNLFVKPHQDCMVLEEIGLVLSEDTVL